jgi:hypothetical protein
MTVYLKFLDLSTLKKNDNALDNNLNYDDYRNRDVFLTSWTPNIQTLHPSQGEHNF